MAQANPRPPQPSILEFQTMEQLAWTNLEQKTHAVTVKVIQGDNWGSGIIIAQQGQIHTVVTNAHVLRDNQHPYRIQTSDGEIHLASPVQEIDFQDYDLALLQFQSPTIPYPVATLGTHSTLQEGDTVVAAGFPINPTSKGKQGFKFTRGQISLLSENPLEAGYQLGYTNAIEKGMSGGPVLNLAGEIVAINGMHPYPLWGNPYIYQDGQIPCLPLQKLMNQSSFAIPIDTFLQFAPQFAPSPSPRTLNWSALLTVSFILMQNISLRSLEITEASQEIRQQAEQAKACLDPLPKIQPKN